MNQKIIRLSLAILFVSVGVLRAADAPKKPWKNVAEGSYVSANGNSKSTTYAAKDTYNYDWTKMALELIGGALGSESEGETETEQYTAKEKVSYKMTDRNYLFERVAWDKDRFSDIKSRTDMGLGLGRQIIKKSKDTLIGELGGGKVVEERYDAKTNSFASGRAYTKYTRTISVTSSFYQEAEYIHNFDDPEDFRCRTETALLAAISAHFSMKASYIWRYMAKPVVDNGHSDTITAFSLVATY